MNREQKAAVVEEVAAQIKEAEAVFAVDYRGISVPQAAELRTKLNDAGARFRVVKNTPDRAGGRPGGRGRAQGAARGADRLHLRAAEGDVAPREGARPVLPRARRARVQGRRS